MGLSDSHSRRFGSRNGQSHAGMGQKETRLRMMKRIASDRLRLAKPRPQSPLLLRRRGQARGGLIPRISILFGIVAFFSTSLLADDWPQWRGPHRDGISAETGLLQEWPKDGPKQLWQASDLGSGYSTPAIVGDRIYLLANKGLEDESVLALSVQDGKPVWSTRLGKVGNPQQQPSYPAAPSTPTIHAHILYSIGSD